MNPDWPQNERDRLEAKLSALLLGELTADEAESVRKAMAHDPELTRLYERLKLTIDLLREGAAKPAEQTNSAPAPLKLSDERRQKLLAQFKTIAPKEFAQEKNHSPRWLIPVSAAAAIVLFALLPILTTQRGGLAFRGRDTMEAASPAPAKTDAVQDEMATERATTLPQAKEESGSPATLNGVNERYLSPIPQVETTLAPLATATTPASTASRRPIVPPPGERIATLNSFSAAVAEPGTPNPSPRESPPARASQLYLGAGVNTSTTDQAFESVPSSSPAANKERAGIAVDALETRRGRDLAEVPVSVQKGGFGGVGGSGGRNGGAMTVPRVSASGGGGGGFGGGSGGGGGGRGGSFVAGARGAVAPPAAAQPPPAGSSAMSYGTYAFTEKPATGQSMPRPATASDAGNITTTLRGFYDDTVNGGESRKLESVGGLDSSTLSKAKSLTPLPSSPGLVANSSGTGSSSDRADLDHTFNNDFFRMQSAAEPAGQAGQLPQLGDTPALGFRFSTNPSAPPAGLSTSGLRAETLSNAGALEIGNALALNRGEALKQIEGVDAKDTVARQTSKVIADTGIKALENRKAEQEKKVAQARAEVARLGRELTPADADMAPAKPAADAPIPQPEIQTTDNAFSTFSLNISDVSFRLAAAALEKGVMPEAASVRSEEFINAFDYRDPEAPAGVPIAFASERAQYPFAHNRDLLRLSLKTAAAGRQPGRALNIVLLLDNSGSMERADRVRILHEALRVLATQLQPQDKLSVVTFARTARLWVDGLSGAQAGDVADGLSGLTPEGGTNLEEAMNLAYATAARHYLATGINRVVLLTDGAANLGNVDPDALKRKVEAYRKQGIALDCFGIGWEGYNDELLEQLARNGDGRYAFLNTPEEAAADFAGKLAGALQVAASDVKVQVEFNPQRVSAYRQIGYAKHQLTKEQFRDNTVDAAEIAAAEAGNALYVVEVNPAGQGPLCTVRVRFKEPGTTDYREQEWPVTYTGSVPALEQSSTAMRLAAAASAFSEWLVSSPFAGEVSPDRLLNCLNGVPEAYGPDARPQKLEWMIRQAKALTGK